MKKISLTPKKTILIVVIILLLVGISVAGVRLLSSKPALTPTTLTPTGTKLKPVTYQLALNEQAPTAQPTVGPAAVSPTAVPTTAAAPQASPTLLAQAPTATTAPTVAAPTATPSATVASTTSTQAPTEATSSAQTTPEAGSVGYTILFFALAVFLIGVSFAM